MGLFTQENRIKCGKCNTEFDLNRNTTGCPLCGFGSKTGGKVEDVLKASKQKGKESSNYLSVPPELKLRSGNVETDAEAKVWGSWLMFNDFCAPKFLLRVLAWKLAEEKTEYVTLNKLMENAIDLIKQEGLSQFKGFPNLEKDRKGSRLVNHFLRTFAKMGLVQVKPASKINKEVWSENWDQILVTLTKEGLEFARLQNAIFDEGKDRQVLTSEEKEWLVKYLQQIDREGYKEYSVLLNVYEFLKAGNNGNEDLIKWFENNKKFRDYIYERSERARNDPKILQQQLRNYARTFTSAKISLLRELGVVRDKRNDYTILGEL